MTIRDLTAALLFTAAPLAAAQAQGAQAKDSAQKDSAQADAHFVRHAVRDNLLEVRLGQVAQQRASSQTVQKFGERMVTDHQRLQKQWTDLAAKHGIAVQDTLGAEAQKRVKYMQDLDRSSFDKAYMTTMIKAHGSDVEMMKAEVDSAHSDPVKQLAAYALPLMQEHLLAASAAGKEVGVDSTVVKESQKVAAGKSGK